ncbi:MAG TPA: hypothetical protein VIF63_05140 [Candidatus Limnocylindrales bacterium]|jgi:hypothetical protein
MSAPAAAPGRGLLFGAIAVLIGVGLALGAGMLINSGGPGASGAPSAGPSGSAAAVVSPGPSLSPAPLDSGVLPTSVPVETPAATVTTNPTPPPTPKPTPTPNTNPTIITWKVPAQEDCTGTTAGQIHVEWKVINATGITISIDGPGLYDSYPAEGSTDLPYGCSIAVLAHTYTLRTTGGTGPAASSTKKVVTREGEILKFNMPNEVSCPTTLTTVAVSLVYEIRAASGVQLYRNSELYATYNGKTSSNGLTVPYDCSDETEVWHLVTDGGYGAVDDDTETIKRVLT